MFFETNLKKHNKQWFNHHVFLIPQGTVGLVNNGELLTQMELLLMGMMPIHTCSSAVLWFPPTVQRQAPWADWSF